MPPSYKRHWPWSGEVVADRDLGRLQTPRPRRGAGTLKARFIMKPQSCRRSVDLSDRINCRHRSDQQTIYVTLSKYLLRDSSGNVESVELFTLRTTQ